MNVTVMNAPTEGIVTLGLYERPVVVLVAYMLVGAIIVLVRVKTHGQSVMVKVVASVTV